MRSKRIVVSYANTPRYRRGLARLEAALTEHGNEMLMPFGALGFRADREGPGKWDIPEAWHTHQARPYAFKAHALNAADHAGFDLVLWADSSILPLRPLEPLWEKIEAEGAWIHDGGWKNGQWCSDDWYRQVFPELFGNASPDEEVLSLLREKNHQIPHVVATTFGLNLRSELGRFIFDEYCRLAFDTRAFCGPWWNSNAERADYAKNDGAAPCGPPTTLGHRHDQSCLSLIAESAGVSLTSGTEPFTYRGQETKKTVLVADGNF